MEIVVDPAEFDRLAKNFLARARSHPEREALKVSISKHRIPSYELYPDVSPSTANKAKAFTQSADGKQLEVQATLIVSGSDFDLTGFPLP